MRREFSDTLEREMENNDKIILLVGDLGYRMFDNIKEKFPDRFINCGASEQAMIDIAIGFAYAGKIPVVYSITTFLLYRPFEALRTYINYENLNVKLIGGGRNQDYEHDGISHWADDAGIILNALPNIQQYWPQSVDEVSVIVREMFSNIKPCFVSLRR